MKSRRTFLFTILAVAIILLGGYVYRQIEPSSLENKASREGKHLPQKSARLAMPLVHPNPAERDV